MVPASTSDGFLGMKRACPLAILLIASGCITYSSPRCFLDNGRRPAVLSVTVTSENGTHLHTSYKKDAYVTTLLDGDALYCRQLKPEAHGQIMEALDSFHVAVDRGVSPSDAFSQGYPGRLFVHASIYPDTEHSVLVWWSPDLEPQPGHVERLDEVFCALERELSALRKTVKKDAPDFLKARGRELPCGSGP